MTQPNSPAKSPETLSMYKTFFKSQKRVHNASPKDPAKRRVELAVQDQEDKKFKVMEKELKHEQTIKNRDNRYHYPVQTMYSIAQLRF